MLSGRRAVVDLTMRRACSAPGVAVQAPKAACRRFMVFRKFSPAGFMAAYRRHAAWAPGLARGRKASAPDLLNSTLPATEVTLPTT